MIKFPDHKASLHLTHNQHKAYYDTVEQYFKNPWMENDYVSPEEKQKMVDADEIWELQWYPDTPIGSYCVYGSTLDYVIKRAFEIDQENKTPDEQA